MYSVSLRRQLSQRLSRGTGPAGSQVRLRWRVGRGGAECGHLEAGGEGQPGGGAEARGRGGVCKRPGEGRKRLTAAG